MENKHDHERLLRLFQQTKCVRERMLKLPIQGKDQTECPYCGGIVDIKKPIETHYIAKCRQCDYMEESWGY